jgi:tRNA nucleotidyltransferase (CCA-adding enzyme)
MAVGGETTFLRKIKQKTWEEDKDRTFNVNEKKEFDMTNFVELRGIGKMRFDLLKISKERWVLEIDKILSLENPEKLEKGLEMLMESGVFGVIIPELILQKNYNQNSPYHNFDLWTHTKKVVCNVPFEDLDLKWTALLHDIAKPFVRTENKNGNSNYINHDILGSQMSLKVSSYLKFSNLRKDFIFENILNHLQSESKLKIYDDLGKK